jgi:hypothetical protein
MGELRRRTVVEMVKRSQRRILMWGRGRDRDKERVSDLGCLFFIILEIWGMGGQEVGVGQSLLSYLLFF